MKFKIGDKVVLRKLPDDYDPDLTLNKTYTVLGILDKEAMLDHLEDGIIIIDNKETQCRFYESRFVLSPKPKTKRVRTTKYYKISETGGLFLRNRCGHWAARIKNRWSPRDARYIDTSFMGIMFEISPERFEEETSDFAAYHNKNKK